TPQTPAVASSQPIRGERCGLDLLPERRRRRAHLLLAALDVEDGDDVELDAAAGPADQLGERGRRAARLAVDDLLDVGPVLGADADPPLRGPGSRTVADPLEPDELDPALAGLVRAAVGDARGRLLHDPDAPAGEPLDRGR